MNALDPKTLFSAYEKADAKVNKIIDDIPAGKSDSFYSRYKKNVYLPAVDEREKIADQLYDAIGKPNNMHRLDFDRMIFAAFDERESKAVYRKENLDRIKKLIKGTNKPKAVRMTESKMTNSKLTRMSRGI